jgi:hypothetical protein
MLRDEIIMHQCHGDPRHLQAIQSPVGRATAAFVKNTAIFVGKRKYFRSSKTAPFTTFASIYHEPVPSTKYTSYIVWDIKGNRAQLPAIYNLLY